MNISRSQKLIGEIILWTGLAAVLFWSFGRMGDKVEKLSASLTGIESRISSAEEERKTAELMKDFLKDNASDLEKIKGVSVTRDRPVEFVEKLEELAGQTNTLVSLDLDENKSRDRDLFFRLAVDGNETTVRKYLKLLELLPYEIKVNEISLQKFASSAEDFLKPELKKRLEEIRPTVRLFLFLNIKTL